MADAPKKRIVVILAGPPGSGKSTLRDAAIAYRNLNTDSFVDTDELTKRLFGIYTKENWKKAQGVAAELKKNKILEGEPLGFETVLGSIRGVDFIREVKRQDYIVDVFYVTTNSAEKCIERVNIRAQEGGHAQDPNDIRTLYELSSKNYIEAAKIADQTLFFDNSRDYDDPILLFTTTQGVVDYVNSAFPSWAIPIREALSPSMQQPAADCGPEIDI